MRNYDLTGIVLLFVLLFGVSCSKFRKIENPDWRVKYESALNYYKQKKIYKASVLFEQIMPIIRGLPEAEKGQFTLPIASITKSFTYWRLSNSEPFMKPMDVAV